MKQARGKKKKKKRKKERKRKRKKERKKERKKKENNLTQQPTAIYVRSKKKLNRRDSEN
jgi:hypothetical protein